jgi:hypothetical protein
MHDLSCILWGFGVQRTLRSTCGKWTHKTDMNTLIRHDSHTQETITCVVLIYGMGFCCLLSKLSGKCSKVVATNDRTWVLPTS